MGSNYARLLKGYEDEKDLSKVITIYIYILKQQQSWP